MLKNYNYVLTIFLYPFILLLSYLKLANYIKGELYTYLIISMIIVFIPSFIMSLYNALEEILNSEKKWRVIPLILFSIVYLPIYFTKYVYKEEKYLGYLLLLVFIPLMIVTVKNIDKQLTKKLTYIYSNTYAITHHYVYYSSNNLFMINVDKTFRCNTDDIGDYVVFCDRLADDSFIGIYSYNVTDEDEVDVEDKLEFHINQTIDYIEEGGYSYDMTTNDDIVQIDYENNSVLITQKNYIVDELKYSLIIMKEIPKEFLSYEEYQKMIDSISFLNYNVGVSS